MAVEDIVFLLFVASYAANAARHCTSSLWSLEEPLNLLDMVNDDEDWDGTVFLICELCAPIAKSDFKTNVCHTENVCVAVHVDGNSANTHRLSRCVFHFKESYFQTLSKVNTGWLLRLGKTTSIAFDSVECAIFVLGVLWNWYVVFT